MASLGHPERSGIDHAVRPAESEISELGGEVLHRAAPVELEHERDVLKQEPAWIGLLKEPEHMVDEPGLAAGDADGTPGLAQVLTREAGGYEIDVGKGAQVAYVPGELDVRETGAENRLGARLDLV